MMEKTEVLPTQAYPSYLDNKGETSDHLDEKSAEGMETVEKKAEVDEEEDDYDYPKSYKLVLISVALCLSVFCMALVREFALNTWRCSGYNQPVLWMIQNFSRLHGSSATNDTRIIPSSPRQFPGSRISSRH
jgi:hypothetical protein